MWVNKVYNRTCGAHGVASPGLELDFVEERVHEDEGIFVLRNTQQKRFFAEIMSTKRIVVPDTSLAHTPHTCWWVCFPQALSKALTNVCLHVAWSSEVPLADLAAQEGRLISDSLADDEWARNDARDQLEPIPGYCTSYRHKK